MSWFGSVFGVSLIIYRPDEWEEGKNLSHTVCAKSPVADHPEEYTSILDGGVKDTLMVPDFSPMNIGGSVLGSESYTVGRVRSRRASWERKPRGEPWRAGNESFGI